MAASQGHLEHPDAGASLARMFRVKPGISARVELRKWNTAPEHVAHIMDGLHKAGLTE